MHDLGHNLCQKVNCLCVPDRVLSFYKTQQFKKKKGNKRNQIGNNLYVVLRGYKVPDTIRCTIPFNYYFNFEQKLGLVPLLLSSFLLRQYFCFNPRSVLSIIMKLFLSYFTLTLFFVFYDLLMYSYILLRCEYNEGFREVYNGGELL